MKGQSSRPATKSELQQPRFTCVDLSRRSRSCPPPASRYINRYKINCEASLNHRFDVFGGLLADECAELGKGNPAC